VAPGHGAGALAPSVRRAVPGRGAVPSRRGVRRRASGRAATRCRQGHRRGIRIRVGSAGTPDVVARQAPARHNKRVGGMLPRTGPGHSSPPAAAFTSSAWLAVAVVTRRCVELPDHRENACSKPPPGGNRVNSSLRCWSISPHRHRYDALPRRHELSGCGRRICLATPGRPRGGHCRCQLVDRPARFGSQTPSRGPTSRARVHGRDGPPRSRAGRRPTSAAISLVALDERSASLRPRPPRPRSPCPAHRARQPRWPR